MPPFSLPELILQRRAKILAGHAQRSHLWLKTIGERRRIKNPPLLDCGFGFWWLRIESLIAEKIEKYNKILSPPGTLPHRCP